LLPYGKQTIGDAERKALLDAIDHPFLTTGPMVAKFENAVAESQHYAHGVAVNSGTAALHLAYHAIGVSKGDEVIVPAITFAATSNAVLYCEGTPVFADLHPDSLLINLEHAATLITPRTKALALVDYAGQPCDMEAAVKLCKQHNLYLIHDAAHSIGAKWRNLPMGEWGADISCLSFHPVKTITSGEGGMALTNNPDFHARMRRFRTHGISSTPAEREASNNFEYFQEVLGFNYRIPDILCALGLAQFQRLEEFLAARARVAATYRSLLPTYEGLKSHGVTLVSHNQDTTVHGYHLIVALLPSHLAAKRALIFTALRKENIGVNVHYIPVYQHTYYRETLKYDQECCPVANDGYRRIITLPCFPLMVEDDVKDVLRALNKCVLYYAAQP
jgi:perosamine synthetase